MINKLEKESITKMELKKLNVEGNKKELIGLIKKAEKTSAVI